eukprot:m.62978 g.62978  ORF g.62978 m.62978 type:complete len:165 (-) comp12443_c0_seq2:22-516(-)
MGAFNGLAPWARKIIDRLHQHPDLKDFVPVEQCNLEYDAVRGAAIEPHMDDAWLWGERLITLNMLSETYLCFQPAPDATCEVAVCLPRFSLNIVEGPARHKWLHAIHRQDIAVRRLAVTFRELSAEVRQEPAGDELIAVALTYAGTVCGKPPAEASGLAVEGVS